MPVEKKICRNAATLLIGNELLSGKIREQNLYELTRTLRGLGIRHERAVMVEDDVQVIAAEVRALSDSHDVVFTSGGVGPTHDDVTLEAVAAAFGVSVVVHPVIEKLIRDAYTTRFTEAHLRMALVPVGAELVATATVPWPTVVMKNVWILPGVPQVFRMKLAAVRERLAGPVTFFSSAVYTLMDEGHLKPLLDEIVATHPEVELGSYPRWGHDAYRTKITFDTTVESALDPAVRAFEALLPEGEPQVVDPEREEAG